MRQTSQKRWSALLAIVVLVVDPVSSQAAKITLLDGRILEGRVATVAGVAESPDKPTNQAGEVNVKPILVMDNGLTRTFISKRRVREVNEAALTAVEKIRVPQRVLVKGPGIGGVGPIVRITPFDEFGRRIYTMKNSKGLLHVVQGITEVTPVYTKVEGLLGRRALVWEMRVATSSIPRQTLSKILQGVIDPTKPDQRLKIVRLFVQSERYKDAREELEAIIADFPDLQRLNAEVRAIRQMGARRLLDEIEMRSSAGQHRFVQTLLESFPADGVAGETLQRVREVQNRYVQERDHGQRALDLFDTLLADVNEANLKYRLEQVRKEIHDDLNHNTLDRMAAFLRLADDEKLTPEQKLSLAVSGWLIGANDATENVLVSLSLFDTRNLVRAYLREPIKGARLELLDKLKAQEGAAVNYVAKLIAHMKPPLASEPKSAESAAEPAEAKNVIDVDAPVADETGENVAEAAEAKRIDGYFRLTVPAGGDNPDVVCHVQLPPEYDPYRKYPLIVTLNGTGNSALKQLDWWAGSPDANGARNGQAGRHGTIVLAVEWQKPHQHHYEYSAREHHAVLGSLRDVCRRFAVDTDRVFLSGHSIGGNAAWDIGLAHPDLWAGVIPIVAVSDRYCAYYWENAQYVPMYFVAGELDGDKMSHNARDFDRYLRRGFDTTVVEFLGRGHEHFFDEVQRLFDWMNRRRRDFYPEEFECMAMRPWDNYFWWIEMDEMPRRSMVDPATWPPPRNTRPAAVRAKVNNTSIHVKTASDATTIWLAPELVDFQKRTSITINGRRITSNNPDMQPNLAVLLEDVRTRGDRLHPFWSRVDWPSRK